MRAYRLKATLLFAREKLFNEMKGGFLSFVTSTLVLAFSFYKSFVNWLILWDIFMLSGVSCLKWTSKSILMYHLNDQLIGRLQ